MNGITQLMKAASSGDLRAVQEMVEAGAEIDRLDDFGRPALYYAINSGQADVVCFLLNHGANVALKTPAGISPLFLALKRDQEKLALCILRALLWRAARYDQPDVLKMVLEEGEVGVDDCTEQGWTALMLAAAQGYLESVGMLLNYGADPTLHDHQGWTAENFAAYHGHTLVAEFLSQHLPCPYILSRAA